jgi:hypothetical protein
MALRPQPLRLNWNVIASLLPVVVVPGNAIFRWVSRSDQDDPLR